jgi:hypothetical protein
MSYRPQFAYAPIPDCDEQRCAYSFDPSNLPAIAGATLAAGAQTGRIPLKFDLDADFYVRAIVATFPGLGMRIEGSGPGDPWSDNENDTSLFPSSNFVQLSEYSSLGPFRSRFGLCNMESGLRGIFIPGGGTISLFLFNYTSAGIVLANFRLVLHGVKAYRKGCDL